MKVVFIPCPECGRELEDFKLLVSDRGTIPLRTVCTACEMIIQFEATMEDIMDLMAGKPVCMSVATVEKETGPAEQSELVM